MTTSLIINFKDYPSVIELLLKFSHRRLAEEKKWASNSAQPSFQIQDNVYYFTKSGYYDLKITPNGDKLTIEANSPAPYNEDIIKDLEDNASSKNVEISNKLAKIKRPKKDTPEYSEFIERRENLFNQAFGQFIIKFPNLIVPEDTPPTGNGVKIIKDVSYATEEGDKTLQLTLYSTGNVTSRGANWGYHEEFWKLYLEIQEKTLENKNEKESY